jgi:hypothetical protein
MQVEAAAAQTLHCPWSLPPLLLDFQCTTPSRPLSPVWYCKTHPSYEQTLPFGLSVFLQPPRPAFISPQSSDFSMAKFSARSLLSLFSRPIIGPLCRIPSQLTSHDIPVLSFAESEPPAMSAEGTRVIFPPTRYTFPCF